MTELQARIGMPAGPNAATLSKLLLSAERDITLALTAPVADLVLSDQVPMRFMARVQEDIDRWRRQAFEAEMAAVNPHHDHPFATPNG